MTNCLTPHCTLTPIRRGLCQPCYLRRQRAVRAGVLFWDDLVVAGLALPPADRRAILTRDAFKRDVRGWE
jgi:hypothetical protein